MSAVLHPTLSLNDGETPTSFASRLALFYRRAPAHIFASDVSLEYQPLINGDPREISRLAALTGASVHALVHNTITMNGREGRLRGHLLLASSMQRTALRICPRCIADDVRRSPLPPALAGYTRALWSIVHLRTCPIHEIPIALASKDAQGRYRHDPALRLSSHLPQILTGATDQPRRDPSTLETYLADRLIGVTGAAPWLDGLEFSAAARICEVVGAVVVHGRNIRIKTLADDDWYAAGAAGYAIAAGGEPALHAWLSDLQATFPYTRAATEGPQAVFGAFYKALAFSLKHAIFDPIRALVTRHVTDTMPVGPGDELFGTPIAERRLHSVYTAARTFGVHPKRLRKILFDNGVAPSSMVGEPDHRVLVDAKIVEDVIDDVVRGITHSQAEVYLNAGRVSTKVLAEAGFIRPSVAGDRSHARYRKRDLDIFLHAMMAGAEPVHEIPAGAWRIPDAAKRANCSLAEIVRLILDKRLQWVGRLTTDDGFLAVVVRLDEIKTHVHGPTFDGLTAKAISAALKVNDRAVRALIEHGILQTVAVVHPINRCPVQIVIRNDFDSFHAVYGTLFGLAKERGIHFRKFDAQLRAAGIKPAFDRTTFHATFYRRTDCDGALGSRSSPTKSHL